MWLVKIGAKQVTDLFERGWNHWDFLCFLVGFNWGVFHGGPMRPPLPCWIFNPDLKRIPWKNTFESMVLSFPKGGWICYFPIWQPGRWSCSLSCSPAISEEIPVLCWFIEDYKMMLKPVPHLRKSCSPARLLRYVWSFRCGCVFRTCQGDRVKLCLFGWLIGWFCFGFGFVLFCVVCIFMFFNVFSLWRRRLYVYKNNVYD